MKGFKRVGIGAIASLPLAANAALPTEVTTAFTTAATDAALVWAALIAIAVVAVPFVMGLRGIKKAPKAM